MLRNSFRDLCKQSVSKSCTSCINRNKFGYLGVLNNVSEARYGSFKKDTHSSSSSRRISRKKPHLNPTWPVKNAVKEKSGIVLEPVRVEPVKEADCDTVNIGEELTGKLSKGDRSVVLKDFCRDITIETLAAEHGIQGAMFQAALQSFKKFCIQSVQLPVDQHIVFYDLAQNTGHVSDLFPFFLSHTKSVFPQIDCKEDLERISDLTDPAQWYPVARSMPRKIIFHAGPTNSGKTYHALQRFMQSEKGMYCGPLRLLAMEVFDKCNAAGVACDLITGETRQYVNEDESPSGHISCTVEMANLSQEYDVAVIDEIQMIGDQQRGWGWTRALLGIAAKELHVCGEETAIKLVQDLVLSANDTFEVKRYQRLTSLTCLDGALDSIENVRPGDCIVCFSKKDVFKIFKHLEASGHRCAVIYGDLPPGTKIMQSRKFNDPDDPCNILVATDAVGMGLNLAIKRVVFYSLMKLTVQEDETKAMERLSTSQAQQIAGRAGRYGTQYEHGEFTTFRQTDFYHLHDIVNAEKKDLERAGIIPTREMIQQFSYHLPRASLVYLIEIFMQFTKLDSSYFMCNMEDFKELAKSIDHIPLRLNEKYTLCSSPLKVKKGLAQTVFVKIASEMNEGMPLTSDWLAQVLGAPFNIPRSISELEYLEAAFDVVDIYLWLSYRYPDLFVDADDVRQLRVKLDCIIQSFLNKAGMAKKERRSRRFDINKINIGEQKADDNSREVLASKLILNSPLQAYTPKPKSKTEKQTIEIRNKESSETVQIESADQKPLKTVFDWKFKDHADATEDLAHFRKEDSVLKDTAQDIDEGPVIEHTADDTSAETDKAEIENIKKEQFLTRNTDKYSEITGSYKVKSLVKNEPKITELRGPETISISNDDIKSIALKFGLDSEKFTKVLVDTVNKKGGKSVENANTGMKDKESSVLKEVHEFMKTLKSKQSKPKKKSVKESSPANSFKTVVNIFPKRKIRTKEYDFQSNARTGLWGNKITYEHDSFSKRYVLACGKPENNCNRGQLEAIPEKDGEGGEFTSGSNTSKHGLNDHSTQSLRSDIETLETGREHDENVDTPPNEVWK